MVHKVFDVFLISGLGATRVIKMKAGTPESMERGYAAGAWMKSFRTCTSVPLGLGTRQHHGREENHAAGVRLALDPTSAQEAPGMRGFNVANAAKGYSVNEFRVHGACDREETADPGCRAPGGQAISGAETENLKIRDEALLAGARTRRGRIHMKRQVKQRSGWRARVAFCLVAALGLVRNAHAGNLDSTNPPGPTMYTLEQIYQQLEDLDAKIPAELNSGNAMAGDIRAGNTAIVQGVPVTGTIETRTLSPASDVVAAGYYEATTLSAADADLAAANIAAGTVIFGVTGTLTGGGSFAAPVAKTGQTSSYRAGDDGTYKAGVAWPSSRFTDNGNGTVMDNLTGLMWTKNANIWGTSVWGLAIDHCESYSLAGYDDWRLPNVHELYSLIDKGRNSPALPSGHPFTSVQLSGYWTSSAHTSAHSWHITVNDGCVFNDNAMSTPHYAWPVRGGL